MKYKCLGAALLAISADASALEGKVVNSAGVPIPGAMIEVAGSRNTVTTSENGSFSLGETGAYEIHVSAPGYSHSILHIDDMAEPDSLVITLRRSVIEQVDVIGVPIHASTIESAQPISVLSGETLRNRQAATLGDSLANEIGVHSNFHGNVASTPIIRGLSGPRVQITQNSLDVSDVSRVGPDHAVASEVSTAEQVEVLRGPATLFFGSGAIGGVVNVVDKRVPKDSDTYGEWYLSHETVNSQNLASVNLNTGSKNLGFHLDGFWRDSEDYEVPVAPELGDHDDHTDHGNEYLVANSAEESHGYTLGSSYLLNNGYVGVSFGQLDRQYGIPGHSHGGHDHSTDEASVYAELKQDRIQVISELELDHAWLSALNSRLGYTDYTHAEVEEGVTGTTFANETLEAKVDILHQPVYGWKGGAVLHYKESEVSAVGEEAFTPPSTSETFAIALVEEQHFGDVLVQLGTRVENVTVSAENMLLPELEAHSHTDGEEEHEHDHDDGGLSITRVFESSQEFTPISFSAGAVWDFTPGYNVALSLTHAERAPSASELLSFGSHIGTRSFEVGALFELHEDDGEPHFELNSDAIELETSSNIDITFRKHEGDVGLIINAFFNRVENYYYQLDTGFFAESSHSHSHGHEYEAGEEDIHTDELPIYLFNSADAELYGFEAQGIWQVTPELKATLFSDYVHAELRDSGVYLPRTPPLRFGTRFDYEWRGISANISWTHFTEQDKTSSLESSTEGYEWLDAVVTWDLPISAHSIAVFMKAENITDQEARVHTSFLKDIAPKPGRNLSLGLRGRF